MANITINIKNCGCGGGTRTGAIGDGASGQWNVLADPGNQSGPPEGYSVSGLADRQCKMAVWLYHWIESVFWWLANEPTGAIALGFLRGISDVPGAPVVRALIVLAIKYLAPLVGGAIITAFYAIFGVVIPGPVDEAIVFIISTALWYGLAHGVVGLGIAYVFTQDYVNSLIPRLQTVSADLICALAQAHSAADAKQQLQNFIDETSGFTPEDEVFILSIIPDMFLTMLFYSADWWPSFDEDYLTGITTTCCGGLVQDAEITPGSQQHCQAAWYIVDMLALTYDETYYGTRFVDYNINPFDNESGAIYDRIKTEIRTPPVVKEKAYNYQAFLNAITQILVPFYSVVGAVFVFLQDFLAIRDYINTNGATLQAALVAATDPQEAYDALQPIRDEINTMLAAVPDRRDYMLASLDALVALRDDQNGLLDLLFRFDSRLANHALDKCGPAGGDEFYLTAILDVDVYKQVSVISDENEFLGAEDSANGEGGMYVVSQAEQDFAYVEGDFGQVYAGVNQLQLRVRADVGQATHRIIDRIHFDVKENAGDPWQSVGVIYTNQNMSDGVWVWGTLGFSARPVRYVRLQFIRGVAFGVAGWRYFDALKVVQQV